MDFGMILLAIVGVDVAPLDASDVCDDAAFVVVVALVVAVGVVLVPAAIVAFDVEVAFVAEVSLCVCELALDEDGFGALGIADAALGKYLVQSNIYLVVLI
ncbi:hypothetical protein LOK49_LG08G01334 [Camellia lanceoleosa]|uniref:Uncharacterized protein n=1 Tax=Camellia lanceoleosa TaxID=1840588 RepID=A0ACC0GVM9_9ERIC|nr:hypothetical protein LOK49_LG08G01334 [Camellia lanceoleosa]